MVNIPPNCVDLGSLVEEFDFVQLTRDGLVRASITDEFAGLHRRLTGLGYEEQEPVICEYGKNYRSLENQLCDREQKRKLTIILPVELVFDSRARKVLNNLKSSKFEVYAVYSQP